MKKFLAVVKREYIQRVRAKMFIVSTILLPVVMSLFGIVPAVILNIEAAPMRVAVVDQTGKMYDRLLRTQSAVTKRRRSQRSKRAQRRRCSDARLCWNRYPSNWSRCRQGYELSSTRVCDARSSTAT